MATKKPKLTTTTVELESLTEWPGNARRGVVSGIKESIRTNGVFQPLIVQKSTSRIIAGNHRWFALKELHEEFPEEFGDTADVILLDVNDSRATKMNLADNKTSDDASWDNEALLAQLESLADLDEGLDGSGFADDDLDDLQALMETGTYVFDDGTDDDDGEDVGTREPQVTGMNREANHVNDEYRIMILNLPLVNYVWLDDKLIELSEEYGTDSNTATVIAAIEKVVGESAPSHEDAPAGADEDEDEDDDEEEQE